MLHYKIGSANPVSHYLKIEAFFELPFKSGQVEIVLPSWRPGRYEGAEYAKNLRDFTILDNKGNPLPFQRTAKNSWNISLNANSFTVKYSYFAFQPDAGASYVDDEFWILNLINFLVYPDGYQEDECLLDIQFPNQWEVATTLTKNRGGYISENYYELTDRPILASKKLDHFTYEAGNIPFHLYIQGSSPVDLEKLIPAFQSFSKVQVEMFGECPFKQYYFLIVVLPFRFYHGVEHSDNTVLVLGIDEGTDKQKFVDDLIGVSSHELFHTWNIKKIRPKELLPYNFKNYVIFNTGVIAEGFTTYYGDLFLVRSGVWSIERYLEEVNQFLKRHYRNTGRYHASLTLSSENLWLDGYKNGTPYHKVSIYVKGAIVSLMLDLTIRENTDHAHSLDDLLRRIDKEMAAGGYNLKEIQELAEELANQNLEEFFQKYFYGTSPVDNELGRLCNKFGFTLAHSSPEHGLERYYGFTSLLKEDNLIVEMIDRGSPAEEKLSPGDQIISINNSKPADFTKDKIEGSDHLTLKLKRLGRNLEIILNKSGSTYFTFFQLTKTDNITQEQRNARSKWLLLK